MSFLAFARRWRSPFAAGGEGEKEPRLARKNPYYAGPRSDHFDGLRFFIPGGPRDKTPSDIAKMLWRSRRERKPWPRVGEFVIAATPPRRVEGGSIRLTFIGHSSFLLQTEGVNLLLDPVWSQRAGPAGLGPRRVTPPGLALADLPPIDAVIVSHNHYDHCDVATLARICARSSGAGADPARQRRDLASRRPRDPGAGVRLGRERERRSAKNSL